MANLINPKDARAALAGLEKVISRLIPPEWAEQAKKTRVVNDLLERICAHEWAVDTDPIPSIEDLADHYGVSTGTIIEARNLLVKEGILRPEQGVGTFVAYIPEEEPDEDDPIEALKEARDAIDRAIAALERNRD